MFQWCWPCLLIGLGSWDGSYLLVLMPVGTSRDLWQPPGREGAGLRFGEDISRASMPGFGRVDGIVFANIVFAKELVFAKMPGGHDDVIPEAVDGKNCRKTL